ncbi:MAG: DUF3793 family protein [Clostridiales bacterium]|nr:DUF3793 family protein [Clostridiales bacterium]
MSEELMVRHCSPTLAGLKTGSIFTCPDRGERENREAIRQMNRALVKKGLRVLPLRIHRGRVLIYVYRPAHLKEDLRHGTACRLLKERGYECENPDTCVLHLIRRLTENEEFPHEIGLFLGYPPEDVCGFIEKRDDCKCVGCWKVYGDEAEARRRFAQYDKCTQIYEEELRRGANVEQLAISC